MIWIDFYHRLIEVRGFHERPDKYVERHHILPKHRGGNDDESNLVWLTYEDHTFAHWLLWKAFGNPYDRNVWIWRRGKKEDAVSDLKTMAGKKGWKSQVERHGLFAGAGCWDGSSTRGKKWWNNGKEQTRAFEKPSSDWVHGRLPMNYTEEGKQAQRENGRRVGRLS